jgi:O-methyltransferase involved in polyketide biosynthesis
MYLDHAQVADLFAGMRDACGSTPEVIATAMLCPPGGRPAFLRARRWVTGWLRTRGEPFRWGIAPGALARTMAACGLQVQRVADADDAAAPDPSPGELLFRGHL